MIEIGKIAVFAGRRAIETIHEMGSSVNSERGRYQQPAHDALAEGEPTSSISVPLAAR